MSAECACRRNCARVWKKASVAKGSVHGVGSGGNDVEGEKRTTLFSLFAAMRAFEAAKARASVRSSSSPSPSSSEWKEVGGELAGDE
jgi:hypothetical protein